MSYQPDIIPSSATGQELQAAIQKELADRGWSTEDDTVMAEYCLVMLGNRKTPDQISTELSDLIGGDFEPSFVSWLFTELTVHYPDPNAVATPSSSNNNNSNSNGGSIEYGGIRGAASARRASGPGIFGQAVTGVKRERDEPEPRASQRTKYDRGPQFEGVPAGPRNPNANALVNGGPRTGGGAGGKSIFDRIQQGGNPGVSNQNGSFDQIQGTIDAVTRGTAHPSALNSIPYNSLQQASFMDPRMLAQAQAHAMAQVQAYAAMQGQQMGWNPQQGYGGPGFNPSFQGNGQFNGGNGFPMAPPRQNQQNPQFHHHQQQQQHHQQQQRPYQGQQQQQQHPQQQQQQLQQQQNYQQQQQQQQQQFPPQVAAPSIPLPSKPLEAEICKHGVDCSKPTCPFSHPSPVATKYSGLVLSSEACEKGLECDDLDCAKSHVSASQKRAPVPSSYNNNGTSTTAPSIVRPPPVADPSSIPGAGEKVCKFAAACTRKGCVFLHPWDVRDSATTGGVMCRWAENCTRADCHYSHPPNRPTPYSKPKSSYPSYAPSYAPYSKLTSYSATFNVPKPATTTSTTVTQPPSIGAWPTEAPNHVSDRLKRFNPSGETVVERIIPGDSSNGNVKVEIELDGPSSSASDSATIPVVVEVTKGESKVEGV